MTITVYEAVKDRLENPSSIVIGDVCSLFHPFDPMDLGRGWSGRVASQNDFYDRLCRLSRLQNGSTYIEVCLRTALEFLNQGYVECHDPFRMDVLPPSTRPQETFYGCQAFGNLNQILTGNYLGFSGFSYSQNGSELFATFKEAIAPIIFDVDLAYEERTRNAAAWDVWDIGWEMRDTLKEKLNYRLSPKLGLWIFILAKVYTEVTGIYQKDFIPELWNRCVCRLAVRLGRKRI